MRRPNLRIKQIQFPHLFYYFTFRRGTGISNSQMFMRTHWITLFLLLINIISINATIYIFYTKSGSAILKLDDVRKTVQYGSGKYKVLDSKNQNGVLTLYCDNSTYFECIENSSKIQVKEYQFTELENIKLFHWDGMGNYSIDDIVSMYAKNINNELNNLYIDDTDKQKIRDYSYKIINAIKSGNITGRDASGNFLIYGRNDLSSTGINETNWLGNYKKTGKVPGVLFPYIPEGL